MNRINYLTPYECARLRDKLLERARHTKRPGRSAKHVCRVHATLMMRAYGRYDAQRGTYRQALLWALSMLKPQETRI